MYALPVLQLGLRFRLVLHLEMSILGVVLVHELVHRVQSFGESRMAVMISRVSIPSHTNINIL